MLRIGRQAMACQLAFRGSAVVDQPIPARKGPGGGAQINILRQSLRHRHQLWGDCSRTNNLRLGLGSRWLKEIELDMSVGTPGHTSSDQMHRVSGVSYRDASS